MTSEATITISDSPQQVKITDVLYPHLSLPFKDAPPLLLKEAPPILLKEAPPLFLKEGALPKALKEHLESLALLSLPLSSILPLNMTPLVNPSSLLNP
jgi:hypothetical protein